jgi:hypothetical protein
MDPMQQILGEAGRRGLADAMSQNRSLPRPASVTQFEDLFREVQARQSNPGGMSGIFDRALQVIPKIGTAARIINAGPVADGTLEHARRMGWMR